jgi:ubiquinone biosynthesis protein
VFRAVATLEGTLREIAPGFEIVTEARAFAAGHVTERLSPPSLRDAAAEEALKLLPLLRRLPRRAERITGALEQGRLAVGVRIFADERDRRYVSALVRRATLAFAGGVTGIVAVLLLGTPGGPTVSADLTLNQLLGYNLLVAAAILPPPRPVAGSRRAWWPRRPPR